MVQDFLGEVSGGICNPAIASALIIWQEVTIALDQEKALSYWTYEYAASYLVGPIAGATLAGIVANVIREKVENIEEQNEKKRLELQKKKEMEEKLQESKEAESHLND